MEATRHLTSTVCIVSDGTMALHRHERLGIRAPSGGHVDRGRLPHETGLRKVREKTGLDPKLTDDTPSVPAPAGRALPQPRQQMLYGISVHGDGSVGHQYIDHVFYAQVDARGINPAPGETDPKVWAQYDESDLHKSDIDPDTVQFVLEVIEVVRADERER